MIPETELNEILARGRAALARAAARPPGCFPIPRRVELALNESLWTAAERAHAAECPRCSHAVDHLRRRIEHPTRWALLLHVLGLAPEGVDRAVQGHLEIHQCATCRATAARCRRGLHAVSEPFQRGPRAQPAVAGSSGAGWGAAGDEPAPVELLAESPDGRLLAHLYTPLDQVEPRIRIHGEGAQPAGQVHWALVAEDGSERAQGELALHPDPEVPGAWYAEQELSGLPTDAAAIRLLAWVETPEESEALPVESSR